MINGGKDGRTTMAEILVTGGCGFIGGHFVDKLIEMYPQHKIVVVDDLRTPGQHMINGVKYYIDSVQDERIQQLLKQGHQFDYIFHLGNTPRVRRAIEFPQETIDNNITSTTAVCEIAAQHGSTVFFAQSSSVQYAIDDEDENFHITDNAYTMSKVMCDMILTLYRDQYGVHIINMFFYSVYGPREADYGPYSTVIRRFKQKIQQDEPLEIYGNGSKERDFTHVDDVTYNMAKLLDPNFDDVEMPLDIHFGRGNPHSISQIALAFDHPVVHRFDIPGEAQRTYCEQPFGRYKHNVIDYITQWKAHWNKITK